MNTQTELITWHKYPDEKPLFTHAYLVTIHARIGTVGEERYATSGFYRKLSDVWQDTYDFEILKGIIAWAELPKGWK